MVKGEKNRFPAKKLLDVLITIQYIVTKRFLGVINPPGDRNK